jgi:hypothetical protein
MSCLVVIYLLFLNLLRDLLCHYIILMDRHVLNLKEGLKHFASQRHSGSFGT